MFNVSSFLVFFSCLSISRISTYASLFHGQDNSFCTPQAENFDSKNVSSCKAYAGI